MVDLLGRNIDYMRISITDRCNLRCRYCMPEEGVPPLSHGNILRYEEILRICKVAAKIGIRGVRVTGGEPLVRKGCIEFLRELKAIPEIEYVALTTNGVLLEPFVDDIARMKLDGVNISIDSLCAETYRKITRRADFPAVWRSLEKAVEAGLMVKVNCVPMVGLNDTEIVSFARLAQDMPVDVRFIEFMPTDTGEGFEGIGGAEILSRLAEVYPDLEPDTQRHGFGPARYFKSGKLRGGIGIIDALGTCFCHGCNRVRLTSDGFLKLCLFSDDGLDLRGMLRSGASDSEIETAFTGTVYHKPERYPPPGVDRLPDIGIKNMSQVGG